MSAEILAIGRTLRAVDYRAVVASVSPIHEHAAIRAATVIAERWSAAGLTTAILVNGLPVPQPPHAGQWTEDGWFQACSCGNRQRHATPLCNGRPPHAAIERALLAGVPFGLRDGLPTAGEPIDTSGIRARLARAEVAMMARRKA